MPIVTLRSPSGRIAAGLMVFLSAFVIYLLTLNTVWASDHTTSFLQLDWAIWTHHSFILGVGGGFTPNSVDDFQVGAKYYSALAPGTAVLALPFVGAGFLLDGHFTVFGYAMIMSEVFVALANSVAAYLVYALGGFFFSRKTSTLLAFVYAFSTISWPFATYFFQSDVSAMFDLLAIYAVIRVTRGAEGSLRYACLAGLSVAAALTTDYVNLVFIPIITGYLLFCLRGRYRRLAKVPLVFLLTASLGILLIGLYNQAIFGTALHTTEQVYLNSSTPLGEFSYPVYIGAYLNLLSPLRGLLVLSIFLVLGLFGFAEMLRRTRYRAETLLMLTCFLGIFLPYSAWYDPTGGAGVGPRFLVSAIPFLLLPAGIVVDSANRRMQALVYTLYAVGVVVNGIAGITSALSPLQNYGESTFLGWTLPHFLEGNIDVWWLRYAGDYWLIPAIVLLAFAVALPWVSNRILSNLGGSSGDTLGPITDQNQLIALERRVGLRPSKVSSQSQS